MLYDHLLEYIVNSSRRSYCRMLKLPEAELNSEFRVSLGSHFEDSCFIQYQLRMYYRNHSGLGATYRVYTERSLKKMCVAINMKDVFSESVAGEMRWELHEALRLS